MKVCWFSAGVSSFVAAYLSKPDRIIITIPPAPRTGDGWAEEISIRHLKVYAQFKKARLVWDGKKHEWEEDR